MSMIVSPKSGKLIKVGGKAYSELLKDPKYSDGLIQPSSFRSLKIQSKVEPSDSINFKMFPLSNSPSFPSSLSSPSFLRNKLPPIKVENDKKVLSLPPLPNSPLQVQRNMSSTLRTKLPPIKVENDKISLPPLPNSPLQVQRNMSSTLRTKLPPIKVENDKISLPPLPNSPFQVQRSMPYSPPSPSSSLLSISLPSIPVISPEIPLVARSLSTLKIPVRKIDLVSSPVKTLPALSKNNSINKLPSFPHSSSSSINSLPPLKITQNKIEKERIFIPTHEVYEIPEKELNKILSMPFYDIPTLEETLKRTNQPSQRAKISQMIEEKKHMEGRGIKTRGWKSRSPLRGRERHQLKAECGDKCFLLPEEEKFPICPSPRITGGKSSCEIDCGGVQAAFNRAKQWKYPEIAKKAEKLLEKCDKEGLKHFTPSSKTSPKLPRSLIRGGKMYTENKYENKYEKKKVSWKDIDEKKDEDCGCGN